ncbi:MAG: hypothetical protein V7K48_27585 [Nostoc sp.]
MKRLSQFLYKLLLTILAGIFIIHIHKWQIRRWTIRLSLSSPVS